MAILWSNKFTKTLKQLLKKNRVSDNEIAPILDKHLSKKVWVFLYRTGLYVLTKLHPVIGDGITGVWCLDRSFITFCGISNNVKYSTSAGTK